MKTNVTITTPSSKINECERVIAEAAAHRTRVKKIRSVEDRYKEIEVYEEDVCKMADFLNGFDDAPYWEYPRMIPLIKNAIDFYIKNTDSRHEKYLKEMKEYNERIEGLLLHLCMYREFLACKRNEQDEYQKEVTRIADIVENRVKWELSDNS